ncbi:ABC-2 type transport system permease protein [Clostridium algifaecis]|uniref:ABC-2 type transport system permease protein n=1 Tax=Clostridium algifaecis TaxID=1472040 RepID=A0ABS4KT27_9CLOT|nr:ABC transporter permease subunit [Clostridium algifaecis]MBP2033193.1 ABC-2 type transport system permease protein [Clostridium algifaecis]
MNLFIREMKANMKSLILWCIFIVLLIISSMAKYGSFTASGQSMNALISKMPESLKALLGVSSFDLSKLSGYYGMMLVYILLMAGIHAATIGANIISKEERDKTTEFLLAKPISRNKIITMKLLAAFVNVIIFNLVTLIISIVSVSRFNSKGEPIDHYIALIMIGMFIFQLLFLTLGSVISSVSKSNKRGASLSTLIIITAYLISVFIDMNSKLKVLKFLTPFKYFDTGEIMYESGFKTGYLILSSVIIIGFLVITYLFYNKRDLNV